MLPAGEKRGLPLRVGSGENLRSNEAASVEHFPDHNMLEMGVGACNQPQQVNEEGWESGLTS
jgi:hypothetical protein